MARIHRIDIVFYPAKFLKDDPLGQRGRLEVMTWYEDNSWLSETIYTHAHSLLSLLSGPKDESSGSDEHEDG